MNSIINNKKLNFILDLDETLISAEATEDYDVEKYKTKAKKFKATRISSL